MPWDFYVERLDSLAPLCSIASVAYIPVKPAGTSHASGHTERHGPSVSPSLVQRVKYAVSQAASQAVSQAFTYHEKTHARSIKERLEQRWVYPLLHNIHQDLSGISGDRQTDGRRKRGRETEGRTVRLLDK